MVEIKTLEIENVMEDYYTNLYLDFGWSLKSSQRIYNQDSHLEERNGDVYSVTKTVNYTKLVFERDTAMPNYSELKSLEEKYHHIKDTLPEEIPPFVAKTPEIWGKKTSPNVVVKSHSGVAAIVGFALGVIGVIVAAQIAFPDDPLFPQDIGGIISSLFGLAVIGAIVAGIFGWIAGKLETSIALSKAINDPESSEHKKLVKLYNAANAARQSYDGKIISMEQVREEAKELLL